MEKYQKVVEFVDEEGLVKFAQDLIRINSVYDPDREGFNEEKAASFVADFLRKEGFEVHVQEVVKGRPNVIGILKGKGEGKTLLFEGHTDVVTAGDSKMWKYDPFGAEIVDGRIYGRGACDTKGNLAAAIYAAKAVKDAAIDFKGKIMLCIPVDEEGMMIGIKDFIKRGWADNIDGGVICEPQENQLNLLVKGALRAVVRIYGKMAHGCAPLEGINPNLRLAKIILELDKLEKSEIKRLGKNELIGYPSITPTVIKSPSEGEAQLNVMPGEAYMAVDVRTIPGQDHEVLKGQLQEILVRLAEEDKDFKATLEIIEERPCTDTSKDEKVVKAIDKAYRSITGKTPVYSGVLGATDGTFLSCLKGIPVVTCGAGNKVIPHHNDEYVDIDELIEVTKIYSLTSMYFLNEEN